MVRREHRGFPDGALVAFGVAEQDVDAAARAAQAGAEGGADRQALAERAGRQLDRAELVIGVAAEDRAVGAVRVEVRGVEPAGLVQRRVQRERGMALGEDEAVAVGVIVAVAAQHAAVQRRQHVGDRETRSDVPDARPERLLDDRPANVQAHLPQIVRHAARSIGRGR